MQTWIYRKVYTSHAPSTPCIYIHLICISLMATSSIHHSPRTYNTTHYPSHARPGDCNLSRRRDAQRHLHINTVRWRNIRFYREESPSLIKIACIFNEEEIQTFFCGRSIILILCITSELILVYFWNFPRHFFNTIIWGILKLIGCCGGIFLGMGLETGVPWVYFW